MTLIETLGGLGQKERVRLETDEGTVIEARCNQSEYATDANLRLELVPEVSGSHRRYQARASVEDGEWTPVALRGYDGEREEWEDLGTVVEATPGQTYGSMKSDDMEVQEDTGSERQ